MPPTLASGVVAIVDDDPSLRRALERSLTAEGYRVQAYTSGEQFMLEANALEISCLLLDIDLGSGMTGLDLGHIVSGSIHSTPIIFMSGSRDPAVQRLAREIGCVDFLAKPFPTELLVGALMDCCSRRRASL